MDRTRHDNRARLEAWERQCRKAGVTTGSGRMGNPDRPCIVYIVEDTALQIFKIGKTVGKLHKRVANLRTANISIRLSAFYDGFERDEIALHNTFAGKHIEGEWFRLNSEDIEFIQNYFNPI